MSGHPEKHHPKEIADPKNSRAGSGDRPSEPDGPALSLVSLNMKNIKTSLNFVYHLASKYKMILLPEHWLYGFETTLLQQVFNKSNFHVKCVDDKGPYHPVKPPRGYVSTCVLWSSDLNHCISPIPDGSDRITAVELTTREEKVCLVCVYMPARGPTDSDIDFASTLDELHEIITKYSTTYSIILGGVFNATLHLSKGPIKRYKLLEAFLNEHHLFHARVSTVRPSYRHEGAGASSLIDHWFSGSSTPHTTVGLPCALNLSDHVEVVYPTHLTIDNVDGPVSQKASEPNGSMKPKIRWAKADLDLYSCILDEKLPLLLNITPSCDIDVELLAATLNSILYSASLAASQKVRLQSKQQKKTLPVWNETISHVVEASKKAH